MLSMILQTFEPKQQVNCFEQAMRSLGSDVSETKYVLTEEFDPGSE